MTLPDSPLKTNEEPEIVVEESSNVVVSEPFKKKKIEFRNRRKPDDMPKTLQEVKQQVTEEIKANPILLQAKNILFGNPVF